MFPVHLILPIAMAILALVLMVAEFKTNRNRPGERIARTKNPNLARLLTKLQDLSYAVYESEDGSHVCIIAQRHLLLITADQVVVDVNRITRAFSTPTIEAVYMPVQSICKINVRGVTDDDVR